MWSAIKDYFTGWSYDNYFTLFLMIVFFVYSLPKAIIWWRRTRIGGAYDDDPAGNDNVKHRKPQDYL